MKITYRLHSDRKKNDHTLRDIDLNSLDIINLKDSFSDEDHNHQLNQTLIGTDLNEPDNFKIRFMGHFNGGTYFWTVSIPVSELLPLISDQIKNLTIGELIQSSIKEK